MSKNVTPLFVQLSEALRLQGMTLPAGHETRIPTLEKEFEIDGNTLREILALKAERRQLSDEQVIALHSKLFSLIDSVLIWIEARWQA